MEARSSIFNLSLVLFLLSTSCISPAEFTPSDQKEVLVVEGFIDNDFGPHEFEISYITFFAGILEGGQKRLLDAQVTIYDEFGNTTRLERQEGFREEIIIPPMGAPCVPPRCECFETSRSCAGCVGRPDFTSNYLTPPSFRGEIGRAYSIEVVVTGTNKIYRSGFERLKQPITLDSIYFEFQTEPAVDDLINKTGINVYAEWQDPSNEPNYYLWSIGGIYKIETPCNGGGCIFDPRDELGEDCWVIEKDASSLLLPMDDRFFDGQRALEKIGFVQDDGKRFSSNEVPSDKQYYAEVSQYLVSEGAYEFYSTVNTLFQINGEIFDPPPVRAIGNIYSLSDPNETVVGYFGAFTKNQRGAFVHRELFEERKFHGSCGDCRYFDYNGQIEIPEVYR